MLPLTLLKTAQGHPLLVELKNGETYNGHLLSCDSWMNINLRKVIHTSRDGDRFWQIPEVYIRGNTIKYLCIPDEVIDKVKEEANQPAETAPVATRGRGRGGRGEGRGGRGDARGGRGGRGIARGGRGDARGGRGEGRGGRGRGRG